MAEDYVLPIGKYYITSRNRVFAPVDEYVYLELYFSKKIDHFKNLQNYTRDLRIRDNANQTDVIREGSPDIITDISIGGLVSLEGISQFTNLEYFHLRGGEKTFPPLMDSFRELEECAYLGMVKLEGFEETLHEIPFFNSDTLLTLDIRNSGIVDVSTMGDFPALAQLELYDNSLQDLSGMPELPNLKGLGLDDNPLRDISDLVRYPSIREISMDRISTLEDYTPLIQLPNLEIISLRDNNFDNENISFLSELKGVSTLELGENNISDFQFLSGNDSLVELNLRKMESEEIDLSGLEGCNSLELVKLAETNFSDMSTIPELPSLRHMDLSGCQIERIENIATIGLEDGTWLALYGNPVKEIYRKDYELIKRVIDNRTKPFEYLEDDYAWLFSGVEDGSIVIIENE